MASRWPVIITAIFVVLIFGGLFGLIWGIMARRDERAQFIQQICPAINCTVWPDTCYYTYSCGFRCRATVYYPCFRIYTTIEYNNMTDSFTRYVLTSWNCTAEYPEYPCYVSPNRVLVNMDAVGSVWIALLTFSTLFIIIALVFYCIMIGCWWKKCVRDLELPTFASSVR